MNAPQAPEDYTAPLSTVLVPVVLWEQIRAAVPADDRLASDLEILETTEHQHLDPEEGSIQYQILDILAKSDGNLTSHMSRHTLEVMYGQMVRNLSRTFTITRKDQDHGE